MRNKNDRYYKFPKLITYNILSMYNRNFQIAFKVSNLIDNIGCGLYYSYRKYTLNLSTFKFDLEIEVLCRLKTMTFNKYTLLLVSSIRDGLCLI